MFIKSQFQTLFAYHWHTDQRLITYAAKLSEADYKDNPGYGHGSIHDLLFHVLRTDHGWSWKPANNSHPCGQRNFLTSGHCNLASSVSSPPGRRC